MSHFSFFDSLCDLYGSLTPLHLRFISRVNKGRRLVVIQESYRMERREKFIPQLPLHLFWLLMLLVFPSLGGRKALPLPEAPPI